VLTHLATGNSGVQGCGSVLSPDLKKAVGNLARRVGGREFVTEIESN
jgi:hypothetical protein